MNEHKHSIDMIGTLPRCFIVAAFFNFFIGACLGGWMAVQTSAWASVGQIHGEINPFGWLTMLIYGMTYAVLSISAGLRPPKAWVGWLQFILAELAVVAVIVALISGAEWLYLAGLTIQFMTPVIFLVNILSAVLSRRRHRNDEQGGGDVPKQPIPSEFLFLGKSPSHQAVDSVGQRGTDVSLMLFLVGAGWMLLNAILHANTSGVNGASPVALFLVYYGWIAGTVLSVGLHLFPRFFGAGGIRAKQALTGQGGWGIALLLWVVGTVLKVPILTDIGQRILGLVFVWFGLSFLWMLLTRKQRTDKYRDLPRLSLCVWFAAWIFCIVLGICLISGMNPLSLAAMHLLFLALTTSLVYGMGYALFPMLLRKTSPPIWIAGSQAGAAVVGALLMVTAFLNMQVLHFAGSFVLLAIGGTLAAIGAIVFVSQWFFTKSV